MSSVVRISLVTACYLAATIAIYAEQITSTCRITAVDAAAHTVTLVRKTASGEKTGVARLADGVKVTIDGQIVPLTLLALPTDATVVYDTAASAVVEIRVGKSMVPAGSAPTRTAPPLAIAPFDAAKAKEYQVTWAKHLGVPVELTNSIGMKFVLIPPGEFEMGSPTNETGRQSQEYQHHVRLTKPLLMGVCEVTQAEYKRVVGTNPSWFCSQGGGGDVVANLDTSRFPVEQVTCADAMAFSQNLSSLPEERAAGCAYRLPTEAEWEYACRGGSTSVFHSGNQLSPREANCIDAGPLGAVSADTQLQRTTIVGSYAPNAFGLHDMHGNVWEWCQDWYSETYYLDSPTDDPQGPQATTLRVRRGGCWCDAPMACRSANRRRGVLLSRYSNRGFRVVLLPPST